MSLRLPAFAYAMALAAAAGAADDAAIQACRAERDDARRLACYDREADRASQSAQSAQPPPAASPPLSAEERFGRQGALAREEVDRTKAESRELGELQALVAEIQTRSDGLMTVTLDNGQVWRQVRPDSFFRLKAGDPVRIQPAAMKSFLMSGPSKRSTRVSRVK